MVGPRVLNQALHRTGLVYNKEGWSFIAPCHQRKPRLFLVLHQVDQRTFCTQQLLQLHQTQAALATKGCQFAGWQPEAVAQWKSQIIQKAFRL
jgi:hypothetical protein